MKISYKCDYALKTLLELALNHNKGILSINDLAKRGDIPFKFLEQVLLELKKGGFVESKRGASGGYFLVKSPDKIIIGEVIRFIEGPVEPIMCVGKNNYQNCKDFKTCVFRELWREIYTATSLIVDTITFAELIKRVKSKKSGKEGYVYNI